MTTSSKASTTSGRTSTHVPVATEPFDEAQSMVKVNPAPDATPSRTPSSSRSFVATYQSQVAKTSP